MLRHFGFGVRELRHPAAVLDAVERELPALVAEVPRLLSGEVPDQ